jgi:ubiquinone/menaquinone biosynthesis C-methylase UbiE
MNMTRNNKVCPVENARALDIKIRKLVHNPKKILRPYIHEGMTVLDLGCGPGYFTIDLAKLVGKSGKVVAADLQDGMLDIVTQKIKVEKLNNIIELHKCNENSIGLFKKFDFILIFYMLHEIIDQSKFIKEIKSLLKSGGKILIVEPKFHVTKKEFINSTKLLKDNGFKLIKGPKVFLSRSIIIEKIQ